MLDIKVSSKKALISEKMWSSGIDHMVERIIRDCVPCQVTAPSSTQKPLRMSALPERPWSELSIDFGQVPGMSTHILVISNDCSPYVVVETVNDLTAKAVILVLDKMLGQFGIPNIMKSDNGPPFNSKAFHYFAPYRGFRHRKITRLGPLANAEVE